MKKRLRKKLHVGEYADMYFTMTGKFTGVEDDKADDLYTEIFQMVADCGCCLNGMISPDEFDLEVITGVIDTDNAARREALIAKFKGVVEANGTVSEIDEWGRRRLAYPINDLMEGYYVLMTFTAAAAVPAELDRVFRITDGVMRSMIVCKDEV